MLNKLWLGKVYCVGDMDGCMKVAIFTIKSFVRYKENFLKLNVFVCAKVFIFYIAVSLNHVKFVLQKQNTLINA